MPRVSDGGRLVPGAAVQLAACVLLADPVHGHRAGRESIRLQEVVHASVHALCSCLSDLGVKKPAGAGSGQSVSSWGISC